MANLVERRDSGDTLLVHPGGVINVQPGGALQFSGQTLEASPSAQRSFFRGTVQAIGGGQIVIGNGNDSLVDVTINAVDTATGIALGEDQITLTFANAGRYLLTLSPMLFQWMSGGEEPGPSTDYAEVDLKAGGSWSDDWSGALGSMPPTTALPIYLGVFSAFKNVTAGETTHFQFYNNDATYDLQCNSLILTISYVGPAS